MSDIENPPPQDVEEVSTEEVDVEVELTEEENEILSKACTLEGRDAS